MDKLKLPKNNRHKGLYIYCKKCKYQISDFQNKLKTECKHPVESQVYKAVLINKYGKRKTRVFNVRDYDTAVKLLIEFKEQINLEDNRQIEMLNQSEKNENSLLLIDCMAMYIDYLECVNTPIQHQRTRTNGCISDAKLYLKRFAEFIRDLGCNFKTFNIDKVDDNIIDKYYRYVGTQTDSASSFNHHFVRLRAMYYYLIKIKGYNIRNPFTSIVLLPVITNPKAIPTKIFIEVVQSISPIDSIENYNPKVKKNRYRSWLKNACIFSLLTGRRIEELVNVKWSDIEVGNDGIPLFIRTHDLKAERINTKNVLGKLKPDIAITPVTLDLREFLNSIGYEKYRGTDRYIIAIDDKAGRNTIGRILNKGFNFFLKKLYPDSKFKYKNLRKTFFSTINSTQTNKAFKISNHKDIETLRKHYIDKEMEAIEIALNGVRYFPGLEKLF